MGHCHTIRFRLGAYMQKVKTNEKKFEESEMARRSLEQHFKQFRDETSEQVCFISLE